MTRETGIDWESLETSLKSLQRHLGATETVDSVQPGVLTLLSDGERLLVALGVRFALENIRNERRRQEDTRDL
jgi:hypothetical protein